MHLRTGEVFNRACVAGKVTRAAAPSLQGAKASLGEKGKIRQEDCRSSPFEYITPSAAEDATFFVAHVVAAYGKTSGDRGSSSWRGAHGRGGRACRGALCSRPSSTHESEARGRSHSSPAFALAHFRPAHQPRRHWPRPARGPVGRVLESACGPRACPRPCLTSEATLHCVCGS